MHVRDTHTQLNTCTSNTSKHLHTQTHPHTCSHMQPHAPTTIEELSQSWQLVHPGASLNHNTKTQTNTCTHTHTHTDIHAHPLLAHPVVTLCVALQFAVAVQDWKPPLINVQSIKGDYSFTCSLQFCNYSLRAECVITSKTGSSQRLSL